MNHLLDGNFNFLRNNSSGPVHSDYSQILDMSRDSRQGSSYLNLDMSREIMLLENGVTDKSEMRDLLFLADEKLETLKNQLAESQIYLSMVVHDMRSPTKAIKLGLEATLYQLKSGSNIIH